MALKPPPLAVVVYFHRNLMPRKKRPLPKSVTAKNSGAEKMLQAVDELQEMLYES
jgi:signal recognition particle subunit SEC65